MTASRVAPLALGVMIVCATLPAPAAGQSASPPSPVRFLSDYVFHLSAGHLSSDDPRFVWDADFGGAIDLVDYGAGRVQFLANYNVGLGEQIRRFDPNQGSYQLDVSASRRLGANEFSGVFHHLSRHLSDRPKLVPVDWNMIGGRWSRREQRGGIRFDTTAHLLATLKRSFVDYRWEGAGGLAVRAPVARAVDVIASADLRLVGVDPSVADRDQQRGWRLETGVHLAGAGAAVELFVAAEQRIDPYPIERTTARWATVGFRFVSR